MKKISLRTRVSRKYLEIPVDFIDEYMPQAPEGALKLYLYLQRCSLDPSILLSVSDMADLFDVTPKSVIRSLSYWEDCGLLSLEYDGDELSDITLYPMKEQAETQEKPAAAPPQPLYQPQVQEAPVSESISTPGNIHALPIRNEEVKKEPNAAELGDLDQDEQFTEILELAQIYLKKPVTSIMRETLGYCYLLFGRDVDIITFLLEYCIEQKHSSVHYMRAVADGWKEEGLSTLPEIRAQMASRSKVVTSIQKAFGIRDRSLARTELDYIAGWNRDFDLPIILEACDRTIRNLHSPSFDYANRILSDWKEAKVRTMEDIRALDLQHAKKEKKDPKPAGNTGSRNAFKNFTERNDDYSDLIKNYYES